MKIDSLNFYKSYILSKDKQKLPYTDAKIAKSLGMIIHYHNRSKLSDEKELGAVYHKDIKSLFSVSDVLSICCPATKETQNLINKETLEFFPKGAVITNVARGDIVDDEALIDALQRRKIYAVGLDVYKNESKITDFFCSFIESIILLSPGVSPFSAIIFNIFFSSKLSPLT